PFHPAGPELKRRNILRDLGQNLRERYRIRLGVGDRIRALQVLQQTFRRSALASALRHRILHYLIFSAGGFHAAAQLRILLYRNSLERRENHCRDGRQLLLQLFRLRNFFGLLLHAQISLSLALLTLLLLPRYPLPLPRSE